MATIVPEDRFATRCVHAGVEPDPIYGSVNPAIDLSTTFVQPDVAQPKVFDYSRGGNPTRAALEEAIAHLEGGAHGFAFASGLSATDAVVRTCVAGDHIVCAEDAYGGTMRLLTKVAGKQGVLVTFADTRDTDAVEAAITPATKWVFMETPTNPLLRVSDIGAVAEVTHRHGARLLVDNTFMSPALQTPLKHGADVVFHSATKYIGGHSDVLAGLLVTNDEELAEEIRFLQMAVGAVLGPFDCYMLLRGIKTLHLRMERHSETASILAGRLFMHTGIEEVYYPGLPHHPGHAINAKQARSGGGMVSVRLKDEETARRFVKATRLFQLAESLGAVESLIQVPAAMTHASVPPEVRARTQLDHGLVRISVGVEDAEDLWQDLNQALHAAVLDPQEVTA